MIKSFIDKALYKLCRPVAPYSETLNVIDHPGVKTCSLDRDMRYL